MERLTEAEKRRLAMSTYEAEQANVEIAPITDAYPGLTLTEAYEMQIMREARMLADGHRLIGGKMGLTSLAKQRQMGMDRPTYGRLFDYMLLDPDGALELDACLHPRVESELAFVLEHELKGPYVTSADVMDATAYVSPAFEVIDSRYRNFQFQLCDGVVDNISAKRLKLSRQKLRPGAIDLVTMGVTISVNGEDRIFGAGGAVLGHPARAVAAYANLLAETGRWIHAGEIVLSGAITAATPVGRGDLIRSEFLSMGSIELRVV